ncbi:short chain dehydrogenase reductase [Aspergillus desertorum]
MSSLEIRPDDIPDLHGKRVIITGGSSGIGLAAATIFARKGAKVLNLDVSPPPESLGNEIEYRQCDVSNWSDLLEAFKQAGNIDLAVSNAGISEETDYFADTFGNDASSWSQLIDVVITSSATAYAPEQSLPVYSASKLALIGLVRALRYAIRTEGITINAVAPAATMTALLPGHLTQPIIAAGLPVSSAEFVGLAVVFSAVATQQRLVEPYGKDTDDKNGLSRWNGRTILTLGDRYTELEEPIATLRPEWFGRENTRLTRLQQTATDFRSGA